MSAWAPLIDSVILAAAMVFPFGHLVGLWFLIELNKNAATKNPSCLGHEG